jgi:hypothetical protein
MSLQALFGCNWRSLNWSFLTRLQLVPSVWSSCSYTSNSLVVMCSASWKAFVFPELLILVQGFLTYPALEFAKARNQMHFLGCRTTKMYGMMATTSIPLCLLHHQEGAWDWGKTFKWMGITSNQSQLWISLSLISQGYQTGSNYNLLSTLEKLK